MLWREQLTKNWGWKIFSLLIATLIWFAVKEQSQFMILSNNSPLNTVQTADRGANELSHAMIYDVPIQILVPPGKDGQFRIKPRSDVDIVLRGEKSVLNSLTLSRKDVHAFVDLT